MSGFFSIAKGLEKDNKKKQATDTVIEAEQGQRLSSLLMFIN
ncbi:hypothetical protein [Clostridium gelidum]|nr:hypothetical protein [Clostridium gelidum]